MPALPPSGSRALRHASYTESRPCGFDPRCLRPFGPTRGTVNVSYPAGGVYGGTGLVLGYEGLGSQRNLAFDVHALGVGVLLVAGVQRYPGGGLFIDSASTSDVVHECFDPDVFEFDEFDLSARS